MKISIAIAVAAGAAILALVAPQAAEARARGWSRDCDCARKPAARRYAHRRTHRHYSSYRPVLAVDSIPVVVETTRGAVVVGQRREAGWWFPHPRWGYSYPWDGYGGPYYGYPSRNAYGQPEY
ncbi:MAG: hypothetical protein QM651_17935 [Rhodoblastus sp.]